MRNQQIHRLALNSVFCLVTITSTSLLLMTLSSALYGSDAEQKSANGDQSIIKGLSTTMKWERDGGGSIAFSVIPIKDEKLQIVVTNYNFTKMYRTFDLPKSDPLHATLSAYLSGRLSIPIFSPNGMTGTWLTVTITTDGIAKVHKNVDGGNVYINSVEHWVRSRLDGP